MAHRMQITLADRQYERLRQEAERTGASLAELVRRAVDRAYGTDLSLEEKRRLLHETAGALGASEDVGALDEARFDAAADGAAHR
ncbi:MAG TPA: ribbon-helix-helix protein, CopG family [Solirubrobacteraceae bacterium]|nr:ribbon-helix-helix protein, CopG family [Solirubrobacteraceae bacterium]